MSSRIADRVSAHERSNLVASKEEKAREPVKPYEFREGMVRKGGLNPDVSRITVRPDPPEPLGTTGGVSPAAAPDKPAQEAPQAREGSEASGDDSSD